MRLLAESTFEYKGFEIRLARYDNAPDIVWHWELFKDGQRVSDSSDSGGWSDEDRALMEAQNLADEKLECEEDDLRQQQVERDRWWLERGVHFIVDDIKGRDVRISGYLSKDKTYRNWLVEWAGYYLDASGWTEGSPSVFSDREAALAAYTQWKEQQEVKDGSVR